MKGIGGMRFLASGGNHSGATRRGNFIKVHWDGRGDSSFLCAPKTKSGVGVDCSGSRRERLEEVRRWCGGVWVEKKK